MYSETVYWFGVAELSAGVFILLLRLAAMRWSLSLPVFRSRMHAD